MRSHQTIPEQEASSGTVPAQEPPFYNCHTHIFNFEHVNSGFLKGMIPLWVGLTAFILAASAGCLIYNIISSFLSYEWYWKVFTGILVILLLVGFVLLLLLFLVSIFPVSVDKLLRRNRIRRIIWFLQKIIPGEFDSLERYANFILHAHDIAKGKPKPQREILETLQSYFPERTRFVLLSMDLDYMVDNRNQQTSTTYYNQLEDLKVLKNDPYFKDKKTGEDLLFPFIHADPRRLTKDKGFFEYMKDGLLSGDFSGIKLYPPLGYFPFDIRLKPVYDLALKHNLPVLVHCSMGPVYYRGKVNTMRNEGYYAQGKFIHPITGNVLCGKKPGEFTPHFTHPLNYYFLMNCPGKLAEYWNRCMQERYFDLEGLPMGEFTEEYLKDYSNLKICLGHYGGTLEWRRYLDNAWLPKERIDFSDAEFMKNIFHGKNGMWKYLPNNGSNAGCKRKNDLKAMNWFSIVSELLKLNGEDQNMALFPNLYADISYNLSEESILPLLKVRLETDMQIRNKILFGTDFYMVAMEMTERRATINMRAFIGEDNFRQIAVENPKRFLL